MRGEAVGNAMIYYQYEKFALILIQIKKKMRNHF
jgi:hypothetical protein